MSYELGVMRKKFFVILLLSFIFYFKLPIHNSQLKTFISQLTTHNSQLIYAAEKQWSGAGDGVYWADPDNWSPAGVPTSSDDVTISLEDASVYAAETFYAKSITVGGRGEAALTVENFVYGYVTPDESTDDAIYIRKDGSVIFKGAGDIIVTGRLITSQQTLVSDPSFMFILE